MSLRMELRGWTHIVISQTVFLVDQKRSKLRYRKRYSLAREVLEFSTESKHSIRKEWNPKWSISHVVLYNDRKPSRCHKTTDIYCKEHSVRITYVMHVDREINEYR